MGAEKPNNGGDRYNRDGLDRLREAINGVDDEDGRPDPISELWANEFTAGHEQEAAEEQQASDPGPTEEFNPDRPVADDKKGEIPPYWESSLPDTVFEAFFGGQIDEIDLSQYHN